MHAACFYPLYFVSISQETTHSSYCSRPEPAPDQTAEVNRLNTQIQLLQIENTETHEKLQLAENSVQAVQESLKLSAQEQKTLTNTIAAVSSSSFNYLSSKSVTIL